MKKPIKNLFSSIENVYDKLLGGILTVSSSFFIVLVVLVVFLPSLATKPTNVFWGWIILMLLAFNKALPAHVKSLIAKITNVVGSACFIVLFASSWISPSSFLGSIYNFYSKFLQLFLNQFFIGFLLIVVAFFLFIDLLVVLLNGLIYIATKYSISQKIKSRIGITIIFIWIGILFFVDAWSRISNSNFIGNLLIQITPYFIPFFGFSLLYLHTNFLIRGIIKHLAIQQPEVG